MRWQWPKVPAARSSICRSRAPWPPSRAERRRTSRLRAGHCRATGSHGKTCSCVGPGVAEITADGRDVAAELWRILHGKGARALEVDWNHLDNPAGPRSQHDDAIGEIDGFGN